jgi:hypothetical protein
VEGAAVEAAEEAEAEAEDKQWKKTVNKNVKINSKTAFATLVLGIFAVCCLAQTPKPSAPDAAASDFEELPELKASEILKPEILKGPHHTVRESVPTSSGMNQFVIDSDYGVFDADGNEMLLRRIKEIYAIDQLKGVSRTDQFEQSLATAAKGPYNAAKNVVRDPVGAVSGAGKGLMKFMGKVGESAKHVARGEAEKPTSGGNTTQDIIGFTKAKRKIAISMGIDPYSTNQVLQKALDDVAWASWAGGFVFSAATFPVGGPAGAALTATGVSSSIGEMLSEKSPAELNTMNRASMRSMGVSAGDAQRFLDNKAFSPTAQTVFVQNLKSLGGVTNRGAFVHAAAQKSSSEADAVFCVQTAALIGQLHNGEHPLARIAFIDDFPICIAKDGTVIAALQWDYAAWTPRAGAFTDAVKKLAEEPGHNKHVLIAISGQTSPRLQQELQNRGIAVQDRMNPGPLK